MQIITSTGYGDSGSSAITDLISEYDGIKSYGSEFECTFLHSPYGLADLEAAISEGHRLKTDFAINKFLELSKSLDKNPMYKTVFKNSFYKLTFEFIQMLTDIKWNGMYEDRLDELYTQKGYIDRKFIEFSNTYYDIQKNVKFDMYESDSWRPSYVPFFDMYYSCDLKKFYAAAKTYTTRLFELAADGYDRLFLDQLLPPISIGKYLNYIAEDIKVFVVDKDPRDLFLVENLYNGSRFIPFKDVNVFIQWYKATRNKSLNEKLENIKYNVKLDELINDYDNQCIKIEKFLALDADKHSKKLELFNPEKSKVNISLYEKYDNYSEEIQKITSELKDYLYLPQIQAENSKDSLQHIDHPIKEIINICDDIQKHKIISDKFRIIIFNTYMFKNIFAIKKRKSFSKKIKAIIKCVAGCIIFLPQLILNIFIIIIYTYTEK